MIYIDLYRFRCVDVHLPQSSGFSFLAFVCMCDFNLPNLYHSWDGFSRFVANCGSSCGLFCQGPDHEHSYQIPIAGFSRVPIDWSRDFAWLVGGLEHVLFFHFFPWECRNPNWRTPSFFRGRYTTKQIPYITIHYPIYDPIHYSI